MTVKDNVQALKKKNLITNSPKFLECKPYKKTNFILAILFITIPYYLGKIYWPSLEESFPSRKNRIMFIVSFFEIPACIIPFIFFTILYIFKIPFFEKFKSNNIPWPWKVDKTAWKKRIKKILFVYFLNLAIIGELFGQFFYYFCKTSASSKNYPSL